MNINNMIKSLLVAFVMMCGVSTLHAAAPVFDFAGAVHAQNKSIKEGAGIEFGQPTAADADGDTVTYAIEAGLDADKFELVGDVLQLKDSNGDAKNDLSFETPSDVDANNVYEVNIKADDGTGGTTVAKYSLTITNARPQATLADSTVREWPENSTAEFASIGGSDANGAPLTYGVISRDDEFFTIDASGNFRLDKKLDFENPEDADGDNEYKTIWQVFDGSLNGAGKSSKLERDIKIKIIDVNEAPTKVGTMAAKTHVSDGAIANVDIKGKFDDPDKTGTDDSFRTLSYTATGLPNGLTIDETSGIISGIPVTVGTTSVVITATDKSGAGLATAQNVFDWTITQVNRAPVVTLEEDKNYTIDENTNIIANIGATDADDDNLTYTLLDYDSSLFEVDTDGNIKFIATPDFENPMDTAVGSSGSKDNVYDLKWKVEDPSGEFVERKIHVTVTDANEEPTVKEAIANKNSDEKAAVSTFDVSSYFDDPDKTGTDASFRTLSYTATGLPAGVTIDETSGIISGTPTAVGTTSVVITATDKSGTGLATAQSAFNWVINDKTPPTQLTPPNVSGAPETKNTKPEITGECTTGDTVTAQIDGVDIAPTATCIDGKYSITPQDPLAEGPRVVTVKAEDPSGNIGEPSTATPVTIDTTKPSAPTVVIDDVDEKISKVERDAGVDVAITLPQDAKDGDVMNVTTEIGTPISHVVTQAEIDAGTPIIVKLPTENIPENGLLTVEASLTDKAGNVGAKGSDTSSVDTVLPGGLNPPEVSGAPETKNTKPEITGVCTTGDTVIAQVDGVDIAPTALCTDGKYSITPQDPLAEGPRAVTVKAKDPSGNIGEPSTATPVTIDTTAPSAPTIVIDDVDGKISKAERDVGVDVAITLPNDAKDGDVMNVTTGTGTPVAHVVTQAEIDAGTPVIVKLPTENIPAEGILTAEASLTDKAGNVGAKSSDTSEMDTVPPGGLTPPNVSGAPETKNTKPEITGKCTTGDTVIAQVDGVDIAPTAMCADGKYSITPQDPLAEGPHEVRVKAKDPVGNESEPSSQAPVTIDTTAPSAPNPVTILDGGDEKISKAERDVGVDVEITLPNDAKDGDVMNITTGTGTPIAHVVTQAEIDAGTPITVKLPTENIPAEGTLTVEASLTDKAGNVGAGGSDTSQMDTVPPTKLTPPNVSGAPYTNNTKPEITGECTTGDTITAQIYGVDIVPTALCTDGKYSITPQDPLDTRLHEVIVKAKDPVGNESEPSTATPVTIDTTKPSAPTIVIDDGDEKISKAERDAGVDVAITLPQDVKDGDVMNVTTGTGTPVAHVVTQAEIDAGTPVIVKLPTENILENGILTVEVSLTDKAGNVGEKSSDTSSVDTTVPLKPTGEIKIQNGPKTNTETPTITGKCEAGTVVTVYDNGVAISPEVNCTNDGNFSMVPVSGLEEGEHTFTMTETDDHGNTSEQGPAATITIDTHIDTPTVTYRTETNGTLTVTGDAEAGSTVKVTFPDGTVKTVIADDEGHYQAASDKPQDTGKITVQAIDDVGNISELAKAPYIQWYREENGNGTKFIYGDESMNLELQTIVEISPELNIEREEDGGKYGDIKLHVSTVTSAPAPAVLPKATPECDTSSYSAFITLFKDKGEVETGYSYADSECGGMSDATTYDGQRLRFISGTKARLKKSTDKGGMVIIIDANLKKETKFGER